MIRNMLIRYFVGSKIDLMYHDTVELLSGKKAYLLGIAMILRGAAIVIDSAQGTNIGDLADILKGPGVDLINQGLAVMAVRAGVSKSGPAK